MSKITLQCVKQHSKLRIKFYSFTDDEGKVFTNVYDNTLNCKFPRDIRKEGFFYEIGPDELELVSRFQGRQQAFYQVKTKNIKVIPNFSVDLASIKIFEVNECVVCLSEASTEIFIPCGHRCTCKECYNHLPTKCCPLCRRDILHVLN